MAAPQIRVASGRKFAVPSESVHWIVIRNMSPTRLIAPSPPGNVLRALSSNAADRQDEPVPPVRVAAIAITYALVTASFAIGTHAIGDVVRHDLRLRAQVRAAVVPKTGHLQRRDAEQARRQHHERHQRFDQRRTALRLSFDRDEFTFLSSRFHGQATVVVDTRPTMLTVIRRACSPVQPVRTSSKVSIPDGAMPVRAKRTKLRVAIHGEFGRSGVRRPAATRRHHQRCRCRSIVEHDPAGAPVGGARAGRLIGARAHAHGSAALQRFAAREIERADEFVVLRDEPVVANDLDEVRNRNPNRMPSTVMVNINSIRVKPRWALEFEYMAGAAIALVAAS